MKNNIYNDKFYISVSERSKITAKFVVQIILKIFPTPKSIIDIGCGQGVWLDEFLKIYEFEKIVAVDSKVSNFKYIADNKKIKILRIDLEEEVIPKQSCDLAICLEVLEHLSENSAIRVAEYLSNSKLVVFSAATPGQGGTGHINEKPTKFWQNFFEERGFFTADIVRPQLITIEDVPNYYRNNILVFIKINELGNFDLQYLLKNSKTELKNYKKIIIRIIEKIIELVPSKVVTKIAIIKDIANYIKANIKN